MKSRHKATWTRWVEASRSSPFKYKSVCSKNKFFSSRRPWEDKVVSLLRRHRYLVTFFHSISIHFTSGKRERERESRSPARWGFPAWAGDLFLHFSWTGCGSGKRCGKGGGFAYTLLERMRKKLSPLSSPSPREVKKTPKKRICENFGLSTFPSRLEKTYIYIYIELMANRVGERENHCEIASQWTWRPVPDDDSWRWQSICNRKNLKVTKVIVAGATFAEIYEVSQIDHEMS